MPGRVRNCAAACADLVRMMQTNKQSNDTELNDALLTLVQGGAHPPQKVVDPTPGADAETIEKLHEQLNAAGLRGV